jgi:hypothetical protein
MNIIELDKESVAGKLHQEPFMLRHSLADHPLFTLPRLVQLAGELPRDKVEFNAGDLKPGHAGEDIPRLDMAPEDVLREIEDCGAWMALKRVELVPEYRQLLEQFVAELFAATGNADQEYSDVEGFIFIASANSTTPFHVDAEENVLAHIRGNKTFHIWKDAERKIVSEEELELSPAKYRSRTYDSGYEEQAQVFQLVPGDGLHVPYMSPHWVSTGNEYGLSMAMTWKTPEVKRLNKIRLMNGTMRRYGMPQQPPGVSPVKDSIKVGVHDFARMLMDPFRKAETGRRVLRRVIYGKKANYY